MNINNTVFPTLTFYYPLGNTPPVCLTQDLHPEQEVADILLLGCGDARNILFTCFADNTRKFDVTCCDIEPGIHARNILLYTLLMDDKTNRDIEQIWSIYYCWKIDKNALQLLEAQARKLHKISESIDKWHDSAYGSSIRFCDVGTLSAVRCYWSGFMSSSSARSQLEDAIHRAKAYRKKMVGEKVGMDLTGMRAVFPVQNGEAIGDITKIMSQWWDSGTLLSSSNVGLKLNPAFLFSPNKALTLHYGVSPLHGVPLSTAYTSISKGSAFCLKNIGSSSKHLINCAMNHFTQWAIAFRTAVANKSTIRVFAGDALAFCFTLRNCQLTQSTSMNGFCHNWTNSPLILHHSDYGHNNNPAPLIFDIVDTSNLADHLGPLNVIALASSLLKYHGYSSLYTETLVQNDPDLADRLANFFGVNVRLMSLMFGLVPPDIFTNATNSIEEDLMIRELLKNFGNKQGTTQARSRLRWKRVTRYQGSSNVQMEANTLANFLIRVHDTIFKHEDPSLMFSLFGLDSSEMQREVHKQANPRYNRASFAFFLSTLKVNVVSDWDKCIQILYDGVLRENLAMSPANLNSALDLALSLRFFGVDDGRFPKPDPADLKDSILAPLLPKSKDIPHQLCVTARVCRKRLEFVTTKKPEKIGSLIVICSFEGRDPEEWSNTFSSVQLMFGKWHEGVIEEDSAQLLGSSDMFVSVMVPTAMLLQSKQFVPVIKCRFLRTLQNLGFTQELGPDLCFSSSEITSTDVFITEYMPGLSALPIFSPARNQGDGADSGKTVVNLSDDSSKIRSLTKRVTLESKADKTKLEVKSSSVTVKFKSPLTAVVTIAGSLEFKLEFPIPVSDSSHKVRIARQSSYVEVEAGLFNPVEENTALFLFPTLLMKVPNNTIVPVPWTSKRVNLDAMPQLDLRNTGAISWLNLHTSQMFSAREVHIRNSKVGNDIRTELKDGLFSIFMQCTGLQGGRQIDIFGLRKNIGGIQTLIFPSCLRLDLTNYTVVLDCALIPLLNSMRSNRREKQFFTELTNYMNSVSQINTCEDENRAWKAMMPALVERCRTWKHTPQCEYLKAGEVPIPKALSQDGESPICSCGIGKFPTNDYLKDQTKKLPALSYMLERYATRAAISPIFAVQYVEDCATQSLMQNLSNVRTAGVTKQNQERCEKCGSGKRVNAEGAQQNLLTCSACKFVKYCSSICQKEDWKKHKPLCKAVRSG